MRMDHTDLCLKKYQPVNFKQSRWLYYQRVTIVAFDCRFASLFVDNIEYAQEGIIPNYKLYGRTTYLSDYKFTIGSFSLFVTYPQQSAHTMCYHRIGTDLKYYFSLKPHSWNSSLLYVFYPLQIFCATLTLQIKVWF